MEKFSTKYFINLIDAFTEFKKENLFILLEKVYNTEIETAVDLCNLDASIKKLIPSCIDTGLMFITDDDRLLLTDYGAQYYLRLYSIYNL